MDICPDDTRWTDFSWGFEITIIHDYKRAFENLIKFCNLLEESSSKVAVLFG
jgi:hypothetical protein